MYTFGKIVDEGSYYLNPGQKWVKNNVQYECIMGSMAYGVNKDDSDQDIYSWCIPPKELLFPHTAGYIEGFGPHPQRFEQLQAHHVKGKNGKEYDFTIYNVVKYLNLVMENNPNMIDSIFVPEECITHITSIGQLIRDNRRKFLHKGAYHKFKGYAYSQLHKMKIKTPNEVMATKRRERIEQQGYDTKFAYHLIRLLDECRQIIQFGDINLRENNEQLKAIRRGEYTLEEIQEMFNYHESFLQNLFEKCKLPDYPDWKFGQNLLMDVLEAHYGSIEEVKRVDEVGVLVSQIRSLIDKFS